MSHNLYANDLGGRCLGSYGTKLLINNEGRIYTRRYCVLLQLLLLTQQCMQAYSQSDKRVLQYVLVFITIHLF
jgi:hypothetical protein